MKNQSNKLYLKWKKSFRKQNIIKLTQENRKDMSGFLKKLIH